MDTLSPAQVFDVCKTCGECCKRYAISVLPHELKREAAFFKLSEKEFTAIYTRLLVQMVPFSSGEHPLSIHTSMIPKNVWSKLQASGFSSDYAMVLPMIGFKKKEYCVFFDTKTFACTMHDVKPQQCTLFPFTSVEKNIDYSKAYDFCGLSKVERPTKEIFSAQDAQRVQMKKYFDAVAKNGLSSVWKNIPNAGDVIYNGKIISNITLNELNKWLATAKNKQ
jgi:Fe-S-cluster containining protein